MPIGSIAAAVAAPIIGNIVSGAIGGQGASQASGQQVAGLQNAANQIGSSYGQAQNLLSNQYNLAANTLPAGYNAATAQYTPYTTLGTSGATSLGDLLSSGYLTHQFNNQDLKTGLAPNYDWRLQQGQAANRAQANIGGGLIGGNALQGLQDYTQNFAENAYQNAFTNYQTQRNNIFSSLFNIADLGVRAAGGAAGTQMGGANALANLQTGYGATGANLYANQGNTLGNIYNAMGNAQAGGTMGEANAYGNAASNIGGLAGAYGLNRGQTNPYSSMGISGNNSTGYTYNDPNAGPPVSLA